MRAVSKYNPLTGEIIGSYQGTDFEISNFLGGDLNFVENGVIMAPSRYYVDIETKIVHEKPEKPSDTHIWDYASKRWIVDTSLLSMMVREQRDILLKNSDWVTLSDVTIDSIKKEEWLVYRQQLRDITDQLPNVTTFSEIVWPQRPT